MTRAIVKGGRREHDRKYRVNNWDKILATKRKHYKNNKKVNVSIVILMIVEFYNFIMMVGEVTS